MATKKIVTTETLVENEANSEANLDEGSELDSDADIVAELLEFAGEQDIRWRVDRLAPSPAYCATYQCGELSQDRIREEWGHGKFRVTGLDANSRYIKGGRRTITLAEATRSPSTQTPQVSELMLALSAGKNDTQNIMLAMIRSQSEMLTALLSKPAPLPPPAIDPMQQQATFLAMMASMKEMFKPEKSTGSDIDTLLKGLELGKEIMGGNSSGADWTDVLIRGFDTVKPVLAEAIKGAQSRPVRPMRASIPTRALSSPGVNSAREAPLVPPDPVNAETSAEIKPETKEEQPMLDDRMITWLTHITKGLVIQASKNKSAELYAEVFLDNLPSFVTTEMIMENFKEDNALDKLAMMNSDVVKFRRWFEEFRDEVLNFLEDAQDEALDDINASNLEEKSMTGFDPINGSPIINLSQDD